jgi:hypothetical protein
MVNRPSAREANAVGGTASGRKRHRISGVADRGDRLKVPYKRVSGIAFRCGSVVARHSLLKTA